MWTNTWRTVVRIRPNEHIRHRHNLPQPHLPMTPQMIHLVVEPLLRFLKMLQKFHFHRYQFPFAKLKTYENKVRFESKKDKRATCCVAWQWMVVEWLWTLKMNRFVDRNQRCHTCLPLRVRGSPNYWPLFRKGSIIGFNHQYFKAIIYRTSVN